MGTPCWVRLITGNYWNTGHAGLMTATCLPACEGTKGTNHAVVYIKTAIVQSFCLVGGALPVIVRFATVSPVL